MSLITIKNLKKSFKNGDIETHVLRGIDFEVQKGEFVAIMGRSGAGKSTFLYQIGLLDHPTSGSIIIDEVETTLLESATRSEFRLTKLGYIFQDYALLPELTAAENISVPLLMQGYTKEHAFEAARASLEQVGLSKRIGNLPGQLSGGEQQRVSIARALAHKPQILFADEPTASLDSESSSHIIDIFQELNKAGQTIVMVTHEPEYGSRADRIVTLADGTILTEVQSSH